MNKYVIIVAGGKGKRMNAEISKQFISLEDGKPILMHSIDIFKKAVEDINIIVVLPADEIDHWKELCNKHSFTTTHTIVAGGETRFHSVKNGLKEIRDKDSIIAIHDGVRPFVSIKVINQSFEFAKTKGAVIPIVDIVDTIRHIKNNNSMTVDRNKYKIVQTPQTFRYDIIQDAYKQEYSDKFTDDASVVESNGIKIEMIEGNRENIKITTPFDIITGNSIIKCLI